jgi:hypothetical protein
LRTGSAEEDAFKRDLRENVQSWTGTPLLIDDRGVMKNVQSWTRTPFLVEDRGVLRKTPLKGIYGKTSNLGQGHPS